VSHNHALLLDAVASALPDREAIVFRDRRITYGELQDRTNRFANALLNMGIGPPAPRRDLANWESGQDHVALYLYNGNEYLEATCGANQARAVPFNVNYRYVEHELAYLLNDGTPAVVVFHEAFAPTLGAVLPSLRRPPRLVQVADGSGHGLLPAAVDYDELLAGASSDPPLTAPGPDDLYILYTGGTTGMPKGTLWRQADIYDAAIGGFAITTGIDVSSLEAARRSAPASNAIRAMPLPPFMHGAAGWAALGTLLAGGTIIIQDVVTRLDPVDVLRVVEREQVQTMVMVGDAFARPICEELERGAYDVSSLTVVVSGGAVLSPAMKERLLNLLPHAFILDAGGSSETGTQLAAFSSKGQAADLAVFTPNEWTCVVDDRRERLVEAGHAEAGWLGKRGAIPLGYLGDEQKTAATFPVVAGERISIPGDRARLRVDGLVELLGRESMTINSGGEKIFAEEVEQAIVRHPDVDDVLVVGRPSEQWGSEVVAVVQVHHGAAVTDADLLATASEQIARYKLPKVIIRVPTVQRSPSGKADYAWAKAQALAATGGGGDEKVPDP
jgi:acyl-CoA synthetase (AMP-forming)/AMP-acid ligase II